MLYRMSGNKFPQKHFTILNKAFQQQWKLLCKRGRNSIKSLLVKYDQIHLHFYPHPVNNSVSKWRYTKRKPESITKCDCDFPFKQVLTNFGLNSLPIWTPAKWQIHCANWMCNVPTRTNVWLPNLVYRQNNFKTPNLWNLTPVPHSLFWIVLTFLTFILYIFLFTWLRLNSYFVN